MVKILFFSKLFSRQNQLEMDGEGHEMDGEGHTRSSTIHNMNNDNDKPDVLDNAG